MNEDYIVTIYYLIDEMLHADECQDDERRCNSASEVLMMEIVAAGYFHNHRERALCIPLLTSNGTHSYSTPLFPRPFRLYS